MENEESTVPNTDQEQPTEVVRPRQLSADDMEESPVNPDDKPRVDAVEMIDDLNEELGGKLRMVKSNTPNDAIATEAFTQFFSGTNFMLKISEFIDSFTQKITGTIDSLVESVTKFSSRKNDLTVITNFAKRSQYFTINKKVKIYMPSKLKGKWLPYSEFLIELSSLVATVDSNMVYPVSEYFAKAINKPEILSSASFKPNVIGKNLDEAQKNIQKFFTGPNKSKAYWGEAFDRNEDIPVILSNIDKAKELLNQTNPKTLQKSVRVLAERAKIIAENFKDKSGKYVLNPNQSKYFSDVLFETARAVELYSIACQLVYELEQCFVMTQAELHYA